MLFERDFSEVDRHLGNGMADGRHHTPKSKRVYPVEEMPAADFFRWLRDTNRMPAPPVRTPDQVAAEALRIEHFKFTGSHPCITVNYRDGDCDVSAACYSEESAAAMVKAFDGEIEGENKSPAIDAALERLFATKNTLFTAIDRL